MIETIRIGSRGSRLALVQAIARTGKPYVVVLMNGRPLTILGYNRQRIPGNWKLMQENIKDPYHPGLLHTWFSTFGPLARPTTVAGSCSVRLVTLLLTGRSTHASLPWRLRTKLPFNYPPNRASQMGRYQN